MGDYEFLKILKYTENLKITINFKLFYFLSSKWKEHSFDFLKKNKLYKYSNRNNPSLPINHTFK